MERYEIQTPHDENGLEITYFYCPRTTEYDNASAELAKQWGAWAFWKPSTGDPVALYAPDENR